MASLRKNQEALQVYFDRDKQWHYVFCYNPQTGIVTTKDRRKALNGEYHLDWFQNHFSGYAFRSLSLDSELSEDNFFSGCETMTFF